MERGWGEILNNGFWHTFIFARPDYFVWGNIILLKIALLINTIFYGDSIQNVPFFVNAIQYVFYVTVSLLPIFCLKKSLGFYWRLCIYFLMLCVPLGTSGYQIWGKCSNVGYIHYNIAFFLLFYRVFHLENDSSWKNKIRILLLDIFIIICCGTNPACIPLVFCAFIFDYCKKSKYNKLFSKEKLKYYSTQYSSKTFILLLGFVFLIILAIKFVLPINQLNRWQLQVHADRFIEYIGRSFLFYFTYPIIKLLSDLKVIILLLLLIIYYVIAFRISNVKQREYLIISILSSILLFCITTASRLNLLTTCLNGYTGSLEDRYYYGLNMMNLIPLFYSFFIIFKNKNRSIPIILSMLLIIQPLVNYKKIFEYKSSPIQPSLITFKEKMLEAFIVQYSKDNITYNVSVETPEWIMKVPSKYMLQSMKEINFDLYNSIVNDDIYLYSMNLSDSNWNKGVSCANNIVLFENNVINREILKNAKYFESCNERRKVVKYTIVDDKYIHINLDGDSNIKNFSYSNKIKIIK